MYGICIKNQDWVQEIQKLNGTEFQHIELNITDVNPSSVIFDKNYLIKVKNLCIQKGLSISIHCLRGINLGEKIDRIRASSIEIVRDCLEVCNFLSAHWLTVHLGTARIANNDNRKYDRLNLVAESLITLLENCKSTLIGIENERYSKEYDKPTRLGNSPSEIEYILKKVNDPRIKVVYDIGHSLLHKDMAKEFIEKLSSQIVAVHLHSNDGVNDLHLPITFGDDILTPQHLSFVKKLKMKGCPIIFECKTLEDNLLSYNNYIKMMEE